MEGFLRVEGKKGPTRFYCKLDPKRKKLSCFKSKSSRIASTSFSFKAAVQSQGCSFSGAGGSFTADDEATCAAWVAAIQETPAAITTGRKGSLVRKLSSSPRLSTRRNSSDAPPTSLEKADPFDLEASSERSLPLLLKFSQRYSKDAGSPFFLELARALLDVKDFPRCVAFARMALGKAIAAKCNEDLDAASRLIQQCYVGDSEASVPGWSGFETREWAWCQWLRRERSKLAEESPSDDLVASFAASAWSEVITPLVESCVRDLSSPKPAGKFCVVAFDLFRQADWFPYDPISLGIITMPGFEEDGALVRLLDLLRLRLLALGEGGYFLFSSQWVRRTHEGLCLNNDVAHPDRVLIFSPKSLVTHLDIKHEDQDPLRNALLMGMQLVSGDAKLFQKAQTSISALLKSHLLVPLDFEGTPSYGEHAVAKLPMARKREAFEKPQVVRQRKALGILRSLVRGWLPSVYLRNDSPLGHLGFRLYDDLWKPLYYTLVAVCMYFDVPTSGKISERWSQGLSQKEAFSKAGFSHLRKALNSTIKLRLNAQLKTSSASQWMRSGNSSSSSSWRAHSKHIERVQKIYRALVPLMLGAADAISYSRINKVTLDLWTLNLETRWVDIIATDQLALQEEYLTLLEEERMCTQTSLNTYVSLTEHLSTAQMRAGDINGAILELLEGEQMCINQSSFKQARRVELVQHALLTAHQQDHLEGETREAPDVSKKDVVCFYINEGVSALVSGDAPKACELFKRAKKAMPIPPKDSRGVEWARYAGFLRQAGLLHNLGCAEFRAGNYEEALGFYKSAVQDACMYQASNAPEPSMYRLNVAASQRQLLSSKSVHSALLGCSGILRVVGCAHPLSEGVLAFFNSLDVEQ